MLICTKLQYKQSRLDIQKNTEHTAALIIIILFYCLFIVRWGFAVIFLCISSLMDFLWILAHGLTGVCYWRLACMPVLAKVFVRLNTPLPASAACERLFSAAGRIFTPSRARIGAISFENQLLLKLNGHFRQWARSSAGFFNVSIVPFIFDNALRVTHFIEQYTMYWTFIFYILLYLILACIDLYNCDVYVALILFLYLILSIICGVIVCSYLVHIPIERYIIYSTFLFCYNMSSWIIVIRIHWLWTKHYTRTMFI